MEDFVLDRLAERLNGAVPALPQLNGFAVGDVLMLERNANPAPDHLDHRWFTPMNINLSAHFSGFEAPQSPAPRTGIVSCGKTKVSALKAGALAKASGLFRAGGNFATNKNEVVTLIIRGLTLTNGTSEVEDIIWKEDNMTSYFDTPQNKGRFLGSGDLAVAAFVDKSWAGEVVYEDEKGGTVGLYGEVEVPIAAGTPVTAGAHAGGGKGAATSLATTGAAVIGFTVQFFKLARIDGALYKSKEPQFITSNAKTERDKLAHVVSWLKLGQEEIVAGTEEARRLTAGMVELAHFVAPAPTSDSTWASGMSAGLNMLKRKFTGLSDMETEPSKHSCAFSVTPESADSDVARAFVTKLATDTNLATGDVTMEDAADQVEYRASKNIIMSFSETTLSNLFEALKEHESLVHTDFDGFSLKGMRPVILFNVNRARLLPVFLSSSVVVDEAPVPAKLLRALEHGGLLITPVTGTPKNCKGFVLGNGGYDSERWDVTKSVKYVDRSDTAQKSELQGLDPPFEEVQRLQSDIDFEHKKGYLKMVRCIVEPTFPTAAATNDDQ